MTKIMNISINIIYSPEFESVSTDSIYDITNREDIIEQATEEIKRRIKENVPSTSDCSITIGHKITKNYTN